MKALVLFFVRHALFIFLVSLSCFLYIAAAVTNTGWFLVIASFVFAFLIVCRLVSWLNVRKIEFSRTFTPVCSKGDMIRVNAVLKKDGFFPSFLILIRDGIGRCSKPFIESGPLMDFVAPGKEYKFTYEFSADLRGMHKTQFILLQSIFPFGIFFSEKKINAASEILVLPRVPFIHNLPFPRRFLEAHYGDNSSKKTASGGGGTFYGLRDYNSSDGLRFINWPKSASSGKLVVKEFVATSGAPVAVFLDDGYLSSIGCEDETAFEYMISVTAGIANFSMRNSLKFEFMEFTGGEELSRTSCSFYELMNMLALKRCRKPAMEKLPVFPDLGDSYLFVLFADPEFLDVLSELENKSVPFTAVFFDSSSFGKMPVKKDNKKYAAAKDRLLASSVKPYVVSKGDNPELIFSMKEAGHHHE